MIRRGVSKSKLYLPELKPRQDLIGLFVGHYIIFIEGSEAPVTVAGEGSKTGLLPGLSPDKPVL
ncbi:hypothetical protein [Methanopyrus sp.]